MRCRRFTASLSCLKSYQAYRCNHERFDQLQACRIATSCGNGGYEPDLVQIKGVFSKNARTDEQSLVLTLSLPTGTLHATGNGKNVLAGCKKAFSEIEMQIKRHQSLLRREHEWKRKRGVRG